MEKMTLAIAHNLFLKPFQIRNLVNNKKVTVVGVSVPVWNSGNKTSEPGKEVFVKYTVQIGKLLHIKRHKQGYLIEAPFRSMLPSKISDDAWRRLTKQEQERWYEANEPGPCWQNVLPIKEGGANWFAFRQFDQVKKHDISVLHFVEVRLMEELIETIS